MGGRASGPGASASNFRTSINDTLYKNRGFVESSIYSSRLDFKQPSRIFGDSLLSTPIQRNCVIMTDSMSEQSSFASDQSRELGISDDDRSPSPPKPIRPRPSRQRTVPAKFREAELDVRLEEVNLDMTSKFHIKSHVFYFSR